VVEFGLHGPQTGFDVPQTFPARQLCEGHAQELIHACEALDVPVSMVTLDALPERAQG